MAAMDNPFRTFALTREIDTQARIIDMACSSEEPYRRWWGIEILDHAPGSIDLSRLADGRHPLLLNHDMADQIGVVDSVTLGGDRVLRARCKLSRSAAGEEILQDVADGIRSLVSIGYMIDELQEERRADDGTVQAIRTWSFPEFTAEMRAKHGESFDFARAASAAIAATADDEPVFRVTRWTPYEISIVSVPADATVGVGRAAGAVTPAAPAAAAEPTPVIMENIIMPEVQVADLAAAEKARVAEIRAVAEAFKQHDVAEAALDAIANSKSVAEFQRGILDKIASAYTISAAKGPDIGLSSRETQNYSVLRAIRAMVDRDWSKAPFEAEVSSAIAKRAGLDATPNGGFLVPYEIQKRDMTAGTAANGGYLVATDNLGANFIDMLRNRTVVGRLGATVLSGLQGNVTIPKQTAGGTAYWLTNEATAITESQQTLGQLALTPKSVGAYTEVSRQLMMQSSPAADQLVMNDLAKVLAIAIDAAALEGTGSGGAPTGISATAGIGSVTGTTIAYAGILEFQTDVAGSNALAANCAYVTTPAVAALLAGRQRFSGTDTPLWAGNLLDGTVSGFRAMSTLQVTAASMVFGDFSQVVIGEWGMLEIALNPYANFAAAISGIRAIQTLDVGIRYAGAFSRATSIT